MDSVHGDGKNKKRFPTMKELLSSSGHSLISNMNVAEIAVHSSQNQHPGSSLSTCKIEICAMAYKALHVLAHYPLFYPLLTVSATTASSFSWIMSSFPRPLVFYTCYYLCLDFSFPDIPDSNFLQVEAQYYLIR